MIEEWKDIIGYEGLYQISNLGNVKSLKREYICGKGRKVYKKETIISQQTNNHGYRYSFLFNGKKSIKYIHTLVGIHFIQNDNTKPQINHKDLNKENNIVSNLEWVTNRDNTIHQYSLKRDLPTGVSKRGNRYIAQTTIKGKKKHIGSFLSITDAEYAYNNYNTIATNPCYAFGLLFNELNFKNMIIAIDFDGTCVTHEFPKVGKDIKAVPVLKALVENGHQLVLFTMRSDIVNPTGEDNELHLESGNYLTDAVNWFKENEIPLYGIQTNPTQHTWTTSPKAYAQMYIDDAALGCPLIHDKEYAERPFVDWTVVGNMLRWNGLLA